MIFEVHMKDYGIHADPDLKARIIVEGDTEDEALGKLKRLMGKDWGCNCSWDVSVYHPQNEDIRDAVEIAKGLIGQTKKAYPHRADETIAQTCQLYVRHALKLTPQSREVIVDKEDMERVMGQIEDDFLEQIKERRGLNA